MMDRRDVDDLLAPGGLSGHERDRVLDRVLGGVQPARRFGRRSSFALVAAGIAACAGLAVALSVRERTEHAFASRGSVAEGLHVQLVCSGGRLEACPRGSHLVFGLTGGGPPGYLSAYAEPRAGGERIWYFPNGSAASAPAPGAVPGQPVERVIEVGPEHEVGRYSVHILVTTRPMSRAEALHPDPGSVVVSEAVDVEVVP